MLSALAWPFNCLFFFLNTFFYHNAKMLLKPRPTFQQEIFLACSVKIGWRRG
uniref:Uncharacterized protein n=1 Tax=Anguilla anguilla TaxID=7936 RepID=A0A0E9PY82_ANGAN